MGVIRRTIRLYQTQIELLWHWRLGRGGAHQAGARRPGRRASSRSTSPRGCCRSCDINELGGGLVAVLVHRGAQPARATGPARARGEPLGRRAGDPDAALPGDRHLAAGPARPGGHRRRRSPGGAHHLLRLRRPHRCHRPALRAGRGRLLLRHARAHAREPPAGRHPHRPSPGLVVIQLDGLSHDVLSHSLRAGRVPEMSRWIRAARHKLGHWNALLPSTTPASQAGILHGNNDGIPNFRWLEKETGRILVANHPEDATGHRAPRLQRRGPAEHWAARSISNIFTGDGDRRLPGDVDHQGQGARPGRQRRLRLVLRLAPTTTST